MLAARSPPQPPLSPQARATTAAAVGIAPSLTARSLAFSSGRLSDLLSPPLAPTRATARRHETFEFTGIPEAPVPSLLRGFSAPVKLKVEVTPEQLAFLAANDDDPFNRWDASQRLYTVALLEMIASYQASAPDLCESAATRAQPKHDSV